MNRRPWTDASLAHLRKWAGIKTAAEIAKDLGRTETAVLRMMCRLKLSGVKRGEKHSQAKTTRIGAVHAGQVSSSVNRRTSGPPLA